MFDIRRIYRQIFTNIISSATCIIIALAMNAVSFTCVRAQDGQTIAGDTLYTDKVFTLGRRLEVGLDISGLDTTRFLSDMDLGANGESYIYVCLPRLVEMSYMVYSRKFTWEQDYYIESLAVSKDFFCSFNQTFIESYLADRKGDTVLAIWTGGKFLAQVSDIGVSKYPLGPGPICILQPLEDMAISPTTEDIIVVLRKGSFYKGPILGYSEIMNAEAGYAEPLAAVKDEFAISWEKDSVSYPEKQCAFDFRIFGEPRETASDTLFIFGYCNLGLNDNADYAALYSAIKSDSKWMVEAVAGPPDHETNRFGFGFDFDNNGIPEYIYATLGTDSWSGIIITRSNGKWVSYRLDCL